MSDRLFPIALRERPHQPFPCFGLAYSFAVICAWRHHEADSYSNGEDYASGKFGPVFQTNPTTPVAIGKGYVEFEYFSNEPFDAINLVTFNKHQIGYRIGAVNGYMWVLVVTC